MTELQERPRFYEGQYLEAADLTAVVDYTRGAHARTLLATHRWGIAIGMDLTEVPGPNGSFDVVVTPGYAWDGFGRPIVVAEPMKLATGLFAAYDAMVMPGGPPPSPVAVEVWARYDETLARGPRPGFETCDTTSAYARVAERFVLEVGPRNELAARRDPIEVAGRTMDAAQALRAFDPNAGEIVDGSIPHQVLPGAGENATWLVPLGVVTYQPGSPGRLVQRDAAALARHTRARQYAGVVAGSVEAAAGVVRVHDRGLPYSSALTDELLCVEGDVRADGDVRIYGHKLEFVASHLEDPRAPYQVLRKDDLATGSADLVLVIGEKDQGHNRLVVARRESTTNGVDKHQAKMVVTDDARVGIGTEAPLAPLHVPAKGLQIGTSTNPTENFHLQSTPGPRALRFFNKDAGSGTPLMSLTDKGWLGVGITSPQAQVDVAGDVRFAGLLALGTETGARLVWGAVSASGVVDAGTGFTVSRSGTGRYKVTFAQAFTGQPIVLVSRVHATLQAPDPSMTKVTESAVVDQVDVQSALVVTAGTGDTLADGGFTFIAIGPR